MYKLPKKKRCGCGSMCKVERIVFDEPSELKAGIAQCSKCGDSHLLMVGPEEDCLFMAEYMASGTADYEMSVQRKFN